MKDSLNVFRDATKSTRGVLQNSFSVHQEVSKPLILIKVQAEPFLNESNRNISGILMLAVDSKSELSPSMLCLTATQTLPLPCFAVSGDFLLKSYK